VENVIAALWDVADNLKKTKELLEPTRFEQKVVYGGTGNITTREEEDDHAR